MKLIPLRCGKCLELVSVCRCWAASERRATIWNAVVAIIQVIALIAAFAFTICAVN